MSDDGAGLAMMPRPPQAEAWTILARGPSLVDCTAADVLPGSTVIAINGAVYHPRLHADYWCGQDEPESFIDPEREWPPWGDTEAPTVVTSHAGKWARLAKAHGLSVIQFPLGDGAGIGIGALLGDRPRVVPYDRWTVLIAIAWARFGGAQRIRLLGCDMAGAARAYGCGNQIKPDVRWAPVGRRSETADFAKAVKACEVAGVAVERYFPETVNP